MADPGPDDPNLEDAPPVAVPRELVPAVRPSSRASRWAIVATVLCGISIAVNVVLFVRLREAQSMPSRLTPASPNTTVDSTGRTIARFTYREGAIYPHKIDQLTRNGALIVTWFDEDEDGWYEVGEQFHDGKLVARTKDGDEDGVFEHGLGFAAGINTVEWHDRDGDGRTEEVIFFRDGHPRAWLHDEDADGFTESVRCATSAGAVKERNLARCEL